MTIRTAGFAAKSVVLSVDWEKDSSVWRCRSTEEDYGGIMMATRPLLSLLRTKGIRASFLVECHAAYAEHHMPGLFPELIQEAAESSHEVGMHIHWAKRNGTGWTYPVHDAPWIATLVQHGRNSLATLGVQSPPFRGGAFLRVPGLARILKQNGITIDSSLFRGLGHEWPVPRIDRVRTVLTYFSAVPEPYFCSDHDIRSPGASGVTEFPVSFNRTSLLRHKARRWRFLRQLRDPKSRFCVLYFHIHELTLPDSGSNDKAQLDIRTIEEISDLLHFLKGSAHLSFSTFDEASLRFREELSHGA